MTASSDDENDVTDVKRSIADASGDVGVDVVDVKEVLNDQLAVEPDPVVQGCVAHQGPML